MSLWSKLLAVKWRGVAAWRGFRTFSLSLSIYQERERERQRTDTCKVRVKTCLNRDYAEIFHEYWSQKCDDKSPISRGFWVRGVPFLPASLFCCPFSDLSPTFSIFFILFVLVFNWFPFGLHIRDKQLWHSSCPAAAASRISWCCNTNSNTMNCTTSRSIGPVMSIVWHPPASPPGFCVREQEWISD